MNRCSPANPSGAEDRWDGAREPRGPAATICPSSIPARCWYKAAASPAFSRPAVHTEIGKIGKALAIARTRRDLFTEKIGRDHSHLCGRRSFALRRGDRSLWRDPGQLDQVAFSRASRSRCPCLPEEIPVVLRYFSPSAPGACRRRRVLTRRMPAIEALGSATVLCVDKTGTLTLNQMSVSRLFAAGAFYDVEKPATAALPQRFRELVRFAGLASETDPFDPMEKAFKELAERCLERCGEK